MSANWKLTGTFYDHGAGNGDPDLGHTTDGGYVYGITRARYKECSHYACKPRVVIDPDDREQVERLSEAIKDAEKDCGRDFWEYDQMALLSALHEFADPKPPEPDEPTGLGAVVEAPHPEWPDEKRQYVRGHATYQPWMGGGIKADWRDLPRPLTVLSPGWEPEQ